jgi:hypothetical protein
MNGTTVFLTAIGYVFFLFLIAWWGGGGGDVLCPAARKRSSTTCGFARVGMDGRDKRGRDAVGEPSFADRQPTL